MLPSVPPMLEMGMHSTFEPRRRGTCGPKVPLRPIHSFTTMRMIDARQEASALFPRRTMHDSRRIRPAIFQKWVKKFNGLSDPYDHLVRFKKIARSKQVYDLHTKV